MPPRKKFIAQFWRLGWIPTAGLVWFSVIFILDALGLLTAQRAITYTGFSMALFGLAFSLFGTWLSYQAYLDGKRGSEKLFDTLQDLKDKLAWTTTPDMSETENRAKEIKGFGDWKDERKSR